MVYQLNVCMNLVLLQISTISRHKETIELIAELDCLLGEDIMYLRYIANDFASLMNDTKE